MLKCKIKKGGTVRVKATGTAKDLMGETCAMIKEIYRNINQQNPEAAKGYKNSLVIALLRADSPVWKED